MSSSERWIPTINQELSIPELINLVRHSFLESEFNEVQNILMGREKKMKIEIENLMRDRDSIKEEARLLERTQGLTELEKLKLEEKLQELKETITTLMEEQRVSYDAAKRAEKRYAKVSDENLKMGNEKNKLIFELNEKINELKNKNLESERLLGVYLEKLESLGMRLVKKGEEIEDLRHEEIEDLRHEKLAVNQIVEELKLKQFESNHVVAELKQQKLEATQAVDELRLKKMESDKTTKLYKSRFQKLEQRIMKVEAALANMLNVNVEDLAILVDTIEKSDVAAQGGNVDLPNIFEGWKDSVENGSAIADAEDVVVEWPGVVLSASNSTTSGGIGLPKKGCRNLIGSWTTEEGANTVWTSPGSQSRHSPSVESDATTEDNEGEESQVSGSHSSAGVPVRGKPMFGDIIEICNSDDTIYTDQTNKRNRTDSREDSPIYLTTKRKRSIYTSDGEDNLPIDEKENQVLDSTHDRLEEGSELVHDSQTLMQKFNDLNDVDSTDSEDESYSDAHMDDLVAAVRGLCSRTKP